MRHLLLVLALAGCLSNPSLQPDDGETTATSKLTWTFLEAVVAGRYDSNQIEAFVESSADGQTLISCAHGLFQRPAFMYASLDGGSTWSELTPTPEMGLSGDCEVAMSPGGAWTFAHTALAGIVVATTQDQGKTWSVNPVVSSGTADRPWISYHGDRLWMSWIPVGFTPTPVRVAYSDDLGKTWSEPMEPVPVVLERREQRAGQFFMLDGNVVMPLVRGNIGGGLVGEDVELILATFDGSWTLEIVASLPVHLVTPTGVMVSGNVTYWIYPVEDGSLEDSLMWMVRTNGSWSEPRLLSEHLGWQRPWSSPAPGGAIDVIWQEGEDGAGHIAVARLHHASREPLLGPTPIMDNPNIEYAAITGDELGGIHVVVPQGGDVGQAGSGTVWYRQGTVSLTEMTASSVGHS